MNVRIESIETQLVHLPLAGGGWGDAISRTTHIDLVVMDVTTDTGLKGTGFTHTSGVGSASIKGLIDRDIVPFVIGAEAAPRALWQKVWMHIHWMGGGGVTTMALAALDIALWDLIAKESKQPLTAMLGGQCVDRVPAYASGIDLNKSADELIAEVNDWKRRGFRAFKVKVGKPDIAEDVERLTKVREAAGSLPVMIDANQGWDIAKAMRAINAYEHLSPYWVEEPLLADDVVGHARLKQLVRSPIAAGENVYTIQQFNDFLTRGALDYVQADICRVGGITPFMEIAALARAWNIPVAPHFMMELSGQVLCCLPNAHILEHIDGGSLTELNALTTPFRIADGYYVPPKRIGHGIEFDRDYLAKHRIG
jgi:L-alanine-DL-glutamate epimerase-like enolase superfamily enzyme